MSQAAADTVSYSAASVLAKTREWQIAFDRKLYRYGGPLPAGPVAAAIKVTIFCVQKVPKVLA